MKSLILTAAFVVLGAASASAQQGNGNGNGNGGASSTNCRVRVTPSPSSWLIQGYDPFGGSAAEGVYSITYTNDGAGECRITPVFELAQPPFGLRGAKGKPVGYAIADVTNALDVTPRAGRSLVDINRGVVVLAPNASQTVTYRLGLVPEDVKDDGIFTQEIMVEARDTQQRSYGGTRLVVGVNVAPSARIGLAGAYQISNGQALVDLGELREGPARVPLNLRVSSTRSYSLSVTSANAGRLRLGDTQWFVPYSMALGNDPVVLSGGTKVINVQQAGQGYRRDVLPIQFNIGSIAQLRAGTYRDTVTIAVAPN